MTGSKNNNAKGTKVKLITQVKLLRLIWGREKYYYPIQGFANNSPRAKPGLPPLPHPLVYSLSLAPFCSTMAELSLCG